MNVIDLSFQITFRCDDDLTAIVQRFRDRYEASLPVTIRWRASGLSGETDANWIEFSRSHLAYTATEEEKDDPAFWEYLFTAYSKIKNATPDDLAHQRQFAEAMLKALEHLGCEVDIVELY
jgi:hypothetical protein